MTDPRLIAFVREVRAQGLTDDDIRARLRLEGWPESEIVQALSPQDFAPVSAPLKPSPQIPNIPQAVPAEAKPQSDTHVELRSETKNPSPVQPEAMKYTPSSFSSGGVQQKTAFQSAVPASSRFQKSKVIFYVNVSLMAFILLGGVAYAFSASFWPFGGAPFSKSDAVLESLMKIGDLKTANYDFSLTFRSEPRDANARAFAYDKAKIDNDAASKKDAYERDRRSYSALTEIMDDLLEYNMNFNSYPSSLSDFESWAVSKSAYYRNTFSKYRTDIDRALSYKATSGRKGYSLTIKFETEEAFNAIKSSKDIYSGKKVESYGNSVTFDQDTTFAYFNDLPTTFPKPPVVQYMEERDRFLSYVPGELDITANIGGTVRFKPEKENDGLGRSGTVTFNTKAEFGDSSYAFGFDGRILSDAVYLRLNKFPSLPFGFFYDISAIRGKWIQIQKNDVGEFDEFFNLYSSMSEVGLQQRSEVWSDLYARSVKIVAEEGLIKVASGPKKEKIEGQTVYKYTFTVDREKIIPVYKLILDEISKTVGSEQVPNEEFVAILESEMFASLFEHLKENNEFAVWFTKDGFPARIRQYSRIVPLDSSTKLKNRQFVFELAYSLSAINKPIVVQKPEEFLTLDEATELVTGESATASRTKGKIAAIKSNLSNVRAQAELFYDDNGGYGASFPEAECSFSTKSGIIFNDSEIQKMIESAIAVANNPNVKTRCASNSKSYAVAVELPSSGPSVSDNYVCIDSSGTIKEIYAENPGTVITESGGIYRCY